MNRSLAALGALVLGIALGAALRAVDHAGLLAAAELLRPLGALWLNALKMTLVPLVFAMVAKGIVTLDRNLAGGQLLAVAVPLMLGLLAAAMLTGMAIGLAIEAVWPAVPITIAPSSAPPPVPSESLTVTQMLISLVPANPVAAASGGAMASLVVFAVIFGFAVSRSAEQGSDAITPVLDQLAAAMLRIVDWVLLFTPIGIFALAFGLALDNGLDIAGFVARIVVGYGLCAMVAVLLGYLVAWIGGGIEPARFGRAIMGCQAIAAGTCSSAATLPLMIETSERKLGIPPAIGGSVLPLAVAIFRFGSPLCSGAIVILFMRTMGLPLDPMTLLLGGAVLILSNMGAAGLPGAAVMYAAWAAGLQVLGLPLELVPLLIAANALPDIILTVANVTGHLAVTSVVARRLRRFGTVGVPALGASAAAPSPAARSAAASECSLDVSSPSASLHATRGRHPPT